MALTHGKGAPPIHQKHIHLGCGLNNTNAKLIIRRYEVLSGLNTTGIENHNHLLWLCILYTIKRSNSTPHFKHLGLFNMKTFSVFITIFYIQLFTMTKAIKFAPSDHRGASLCFHVWPSFCVRESLLFIFHDVYILCSLVYMGEWLWREYISEWHLKTACIFLANIVLRLTGWSRGILYIDTFHMCQMEFASK